MISTIHLVNYDNINKYHLKIYDCGYANLGTDWHSNVVNPSYSRLYFILGGDGWIESAEGRQELKAGHCYLLPSLFSFRCGCKTQMRQFFFHMAMLDENSQDVFPFVTSPLECPSSPSGIEEMSRVMLAQDLTTADAMLIHSQLLGAIARLFLTKQISLPDKEYSPCVSYALQYIHQHVSARLTLEEVTKYSFASQPTLSRKFRQELGITVGRYIENLVFTEAQCLLRDPALSIADISERLGFCDQFYFSSRFKRRFNESPLSYRKSAVI